MKEVRRNFWNFYYKLCLSRYRGARFKIYRRGCKIKWVVVAGYIVSEHDSYVEARYAREKYRAKVAAQGFCGDFYKIMTREEYDRRAAGRRGYDSD